MPDHGDKGFARALALVSLLLASPLAPAADEGYLDTLRQEASKVDGKPVTESAGEEPAASPAEVSNAEFENLLKEKYLGSYTFLRKLPRHTQEEIFEDYKRGAPMAEIRSKIMDRFLQR